MGFVRQKSQDVQNDNIQNEIEEWVTGYIVIDCQQKQLTVIQIYAPTSDCTEKKSLKKNQEWNSLGGDGESVVIVLRDFNPVVAEGAADLIVGWYGLGKRNDDG